MNNNNRCCPPNPCCNPLSPCCVIVKPCQPKCCPSPCCPPPPICGIGCPRPDPRCCPKPIVVGFKCPTAICPMNRGADDDCSDRPVKCPVIRTDGPLCGTGSALGCGQRAPAEYCMMTAMPMPQSGGGCGCGNGRN